MLGMLKMLDKIVGGISVGSHVLVPFGVLDQERSENTQLATLSGLLFYRDGRPTNLTPVEYEDFVDSLTGQAAAYSLSAVRRGDLVVDFLARRISLDGAELRFTPKEYEIMRELVRDERRVVTYRDFWATVYMEDLGYKEDTDRIRTHIKHIRSKLGDHSWMIRSVSCVGYYLTTDKPA